MQETRVWSVMNETNNLCPMSSIYKADGWKPSSPNPFYKADGRHACLSCPICSTPSNQPSRRCGTSSMLRSRQACLSCPVCSTPRNQPSMRRGAPSLCSTSTADAADLQVVLARLGIPQDSTVCRAMIVAAGRGNWDGRMNLTQLITFLCNGLSAEPLPRRN